jgi:REP-associated tyrosine transposase
MVTQNRASQQIYARMEKEIELSHIRDWCRQKASKYFEEIGEGDRFWQPKYHSFEIYGNAKLEEKIQCVHSNPVRAGLVKQATDWKWSSARWYEWRKSVGVPIKWIE